MDKKTAQNTKSENRKIQEGIDLDVLHQFLDEEDEGKTRQRQILETSYEKAKGGDSKLMIWFLEKKYGKATDKVALTSDGNITIINKFLDE